MRIRFGALLLVGLLGASLAQASVITYDFTTQGGHSGSFSFDDANTTTVSAPPGANAGASWYSAISFVVDGTPRSSPLIGIYDNLLNAFDCVSLDPASGGTNGLTLCGPTSLFSGSALTVASNLALSDFTSVAAVTVDGAGYAIESLTKIDSVAEPATLALLGLGLVGIGVARRKHLHARASPAHASARAATGRAA